LRLERHKQYAAISIGSPEFWRESKPDPGSQRQSVLLVNWAESWARAHGQFGCTAHRIELARLDILKLLPELPDQPQALPVSDAENLEPGIPCASDAGRPGIIRARKGLLKAYPPVGRPPRDHGPDVVLNNVNRALGVLDLKDTSRNSVARAASSPRSC
jgi:hypothetical protein